MIATTVDFDGAVPVSPEGFGLLQNTYARGLLGVTVSHFGGLGKIFYQGRTPEAANHALYSADTSSSYMRLFRHQITVDGEAYNLEFADTIHFPFGYRSHFRIRELGVEVCHRLTLLETAIVYSVEVVSNPRGHRIGQRFEHHTGAASPGNSSVQRSVSAWEAYAPCAGWSQDFADRVTDEAWERMLAEMNRPPNPVNYPMIHPGLRESRTRVAFFGGEDEMVLRTTHSSRSYFSCGEFTEGFHACVLQLRELDREYDQHALALRPVVEKAVKDAEAGYYHVLEATPGFRMGEEAFESCLKNVHPTLESLMTEQPRGGLRASSTYYWIWGWDSLISSDAHLLAGRADFVRDMLRFYRDTAHPDYGYGHMFTRDLNVALVQAPSAQCLYIIQVYHYFVQAGDGGAIREFYAFCKEIFERNLESVNDRGMGEGPALFPDYPTYAGHNGHDISLFNNSLLYQGARCMEVLAAAVDDEELGRQAAQLARRLERTIIETFWDDERGYFVDSVDSRTFEQRRSYPAHAFVWQSSWLDDLAGDKLASCGNFQNENLRTKRGFLMYPRWDKGAYDGDGNQLGQIWQTHDVFVLRCQARAGNQDALQGWIEQCEWYWRQHTYIEGYSAQTVNDSGTLDLPGGKQAFGAKSIYGASFAGIAGIHLDVGGVTLMEGIEKPVEVAAVPFRQRKVSYSLRGAGRYPARLLVDGVAIRGTRKIPARLLEKASEVIYERTSERPDSPVLLTLHGGVVHEIESGGGRLTATVSGWGHVCARFFLPKCADLSLDGRAVAMEYDEASGEALVWLNLCDKQVHSLRLDVRLLIRK